MQSKRSSIFRQPNRTVRQSVSLVVIIMSRASSASVRVTDVAEPAIGGRASPIGRPRDDAVRMTGALAPSSEERAPMENRNGQTG